MLAVHLMLADIRYGLRQLFKNPGFTIVAVLTLALGIGANSAIFSVVDSVLLRPLPFPDAARLVVLSETRPGMGEMSVAYPNYLDWRKVQHSFDDLSVFRSDDFNLTGSGEPERLQGAFVTASFFHVMGLAPILGQYFAARDDRPGGANNVVLSETLWRSRFGSDRGIVGRALVLNGIPYQVIGVMPAALASLLQVDLCAPFGYYADRRYLTQRDSHPGLYGLARLRAGTSIEQAQRDLDAICKNLQAQFPATNAGSGVHFTPLLEQAVGEYRKTLWLLAGAAGFVLLIACANVALLLLARGATREKEIAIRSALGASRHRVVAQLLMESLLLAVIGGGLGVLFAAWGVDAILALIPPDIPRFHEVHLDGRVLGFAGALSVGTGLVFGLLPALKMTRSNLRSGLHEGGGPRGSRRQQSQRLLVIGQVALAFVLLTGAGLFAKSLLALHNARLGFDPNHLLTMKLKLPGWNYRDRSDGQAEMVAFYERLLEQVGGVAGVEAAAVSDNPPFAGEGSQDAFAVTGKPDPKPGEEAYAEAQCVSSDFFRAMGMPLLRGRNFESGDAAGKPRVVIIDQSFARRYFPDQDPVGRQINNLGNGADRRQFTIIGVVPTVERGNFATGTPKRVQIYYPATQYPSLQTTLLVRTAGEPLEWSRAVRRSVSAIDPTQPVFGVRAMGSWVADSFTTPRLAAILVGLFSTLALLLAALGLYGTVAYMVGQRTKEIGIRMAVGAQRGQMLTMILRQSLTMAAIGIGVGLLGAFAATRLLTALLFGVGATDVATYVVVIALLGIAAFLAAIVPARRAMKIDPMVALRSE